MARLLVSKFLGDSISSRLFKSNATTMNKRLNLLSPIYEYVNMNMNNVPIIKPPTYASYAPISDVTDLCFIGCYA